VLLLVGACVAGTGAAAVWAQEPAAVKEESATSPDALWSRVVDRYEVVVLSRGLLLEPLDEQVELRTIEISDDGVAVDGEIVDQIALSELLGEEESALIVQLVEMDRSERRVLFESGGVVTEDVIEDRVEDYAEHEVDEEMEADEGRHSRDRDHRKYRDSQIVVGNSLTIEEDEVADEAVVFGGSLYVLGKVAGDAAAIGGPVVVSGEVTGDVAAVGGDLTVESGAEILGDAVSVGGNVEIDDDARVRGQIIEVPFGPNLRFGAWPGAIFRGRHWWGDPDDMFHLTPWNVATKFMWQTFGLIVLGLLACLVMLVARQPLERVQQKAAMEPWKSGLVGLLTQILFGPLLILVILILVISIIGIPLLLLVPFFVLALVLVAFLGYCGVALGIGRFLQDRFGWKLNNPYFVLLLGVLAIQIWCIISDLLDLGWGPLWFFAVMFGIFGVLVKYVAWTVGLGAGVLTRFGTATTWGSRGPASYVPAPPVSGLEPEEFPAPSAPPVLPDQDFDEPRSEEPPDEPDRSL
jgi:hypothetical protein